MIYEKERQSFIIVIVMEMLTIAAPSTLESCIKMKI